MSFDFLKSMH